MRILGIDPGLRITGFGVIDVRRLRACATSPAARSSTDAAARLTCRARLQDHLRRRARGRRALPAAVRLSVEIVFVNVNPQSTLAARAGARRGHHRRWSTGGLEVSEYTALQMKKAIVGHGHATQGTGAGDGACGCSRCPALPSKDAADALGLAICHAHAGASFAAMAKGATLARRSHAQFKGGRTY
ncbi:MAG: crossover junction endodeoxyribonuclease RuvC [Burkholderiaceae bacterium]